MSAFEGIDKAFVGAIVDNGSFGLPVAFENDRYDDSDGEPYLRVFLLPAPTTQATLGDTGCDEHIGIFQINIKYPTNTGASIIKQKADEINAIIKSGATFTNDDVNVRIKNVSIQNVTVSDGFAVLPMLIEYFAFTERL